MRSLPFMRPLCAVSPACAAIVAAALTIAACGGSSGGGVASTAGGSTTAIVQEADFVRLPGGTFVMGTPPDTPNLSELAHEHGLAQGEQPAHPVTLKPFWIGRHEVTVGEFAAFVKATGYRTESEQLGWSGVFDTSTGVWTKVDGADWRRPEGPALATAALGKATSLETSREPVTQVSWNDAQAYARWAGGRLPTEAEWEYAARGGLVSEPYVWGREARPDARTNGRPPANWWQGPFPERNTGEDGFLRRAPTGSFPPNGFGLHDMAGNVWEWCSDWFDRRYYASSPRENPTGPDAGSERVMRGGSWMCADNFCANYRPAARSSATPDSGLNNVGFRMVRDSSPVK